MFALLRRPSAFLPLSMSTVVFAMILLELARFGAVREADEGAAAHLFQILGIIYLTHRVDSARLANLLDMLKRYAESFYQLGTHMTAVKDVLTESAMLGLTVEAMRSEGMAVDTKTVQELHDATKRKLAPSLQQEIKKWIPRFRELFSALDMTISLREIDRWEKSFLKNAVSLDQIRAAVEALDNLINHELADRSLLYLDRRRAARYEAYRTGWESALEKFDIARDVEEAEKCLALDRFTACVFHLMRIAEIGVQALGAHFNLNEDTLRESWGNIVNALDGPIKKIRDKDERARWALIVDDMCHMNFALRIPSMHPRSDLGTYTDEQAEEVLGTVRTMMRHLAEALPPVA